MGEIQLAFSERRFSPADADPLLPFREGAVELGLVGSEEEIPVKMPLATNASVQQVPTLTATQPQVVEADLRRVLRKPLNPLTSVRFFAAFYVILYHFAARPAAEHGGPAAVCNFLANGWMGVAFFFLLSGFILTYSYSGQIGSHGDRRRFWEARFARMYPVYLLSLIANWPFRGSMTPGTMAAALVALQAWNPWKPYLAQAWNFPAWTLSVEAFFYLCFPVALPLCARLSRRWRSALAVALFAIIIGCDTPIRLEEQTPAWHAMLGWLPIPVVRLPEFLLGILLAQQFMQGAAKSNGWRVAGYLVAAVVLLSSVRGRWLSLVIVPFSGLLYELASQSADSSRSWLSWLTARWLIFLGGASYSIYLLQFPVRNWARFALTPWGPHGNLVGALLSPLLTILTACLVFHWYEEPSRRLLKHWFTMREYGFRARD
jgi:peptidoglycan/LPS O-acetylase OafA/YrhL